MPEENSNSALQITFYVSEQSPPPLVACRIAQKAVDQGHAVHIRTPDAQASEDLDRQLWTFQKQGFLPHSVGSPVSQYVHVTLHDTWAPEQRDVLINLTDEAVEDTDGYARIVEIVGPSDAAKSSGRNRFRNYRERGLEPETHTLTK